MSLRIAWSTRAQRELTEITWQDAAWICAEVARYAEHGTGEVRRTLLSTGASAPVLFLPGFRVLLAYDRATRELWVLSVYRPPARRT